MVARANGVGPRLAARIVAELKDKPIGDGPITLAAPSHAPTSPSGEAVAALMGLGVAEAAARRAVDQASARADDTVDVAHLVRAALKELGR